MTRLRCQSDSFSASHDVYTHRATTYSSLFQQLQVHSTRAGAAQPLAKKPRVTERADRDKEDQEFGQPSIVIDSDGHMTGVTAAESAQPVSSAATRPGGHSPSFSFLFFRLVLLLLDCTSVDR